MNASNLVSFSHAKGQLTYHLEWAPKYRYNMFRQEKYIKLCEEILQEVAKRHGIAIRELSVMPDHIHVIVDVPPTMSVSKALNLLKGASAYDLFRHQPKFRLATQGDTSGAQENSTEALAMQILRPLQSMSEIKDWYIRYKLR